MEVILKNVRLRFFKGFHPGKPHASTPDRPGKYGANGIMDMDSEAFKVAQTAFMQVAQEKFGDNWKTIIGAMERSKKCIRKGDENLTKEGEIRPEFAGKMFIAATNKTKPAIVAGQRTKPKGFNGLGDDGKSYSDGFAQLTEADGKPYDGCWVNMKVDIYAIKAKGEISAGVYATLKAVQLVREPTAEEGGFGPGPATAEGFDELEDSAPASAGAAADLF